MNHYTACLFAIMTNRDQSQLIMNNCNSSWLIGMSRRRSTACVFISTPISTHFLTAALTGLNQGHVTKLRFVFYAGTAFCNHQCGWDSQQQKKGEKSPQLTWGQVLRSSSIIKKTSALHLNNKSRQCFPELSPVKGRDTHPTTSQDTSVSQWCHLHPLTMNLLLRGTGGWYERSGAG